MKSMVIAMMACVYSIASLAQNPAITKKNFTYKQKSPVYLKGKRYYPTSTEKAL